MKPGVCFIITIALLACCSASRIQKMGVAKAGEEHSDLTTKAAAREAAAIQDEEERLEAFEGSPSAAFESLEEIEPASEAFRKAARTYANAKNPFMSLEDMSKKQVVLSDGTDLLSFPEGMTVADIFPTLYGAQSDLFARFHERRNDKDLKMSQPRPLSAEGAAWASVATLSCKAPIPVLGSKPYKEVQRLALCQEGDGVSQRTVTLAVQTVGKTQAGWPYGDFVSENLYLFSQVDGKGAIRFRAIAPAPTGTFAGSALEGYKTSLADFVAVANEILQDWKAKGVANEENPGGNPSAEDSLDHSGDHSDDSSPDGEDAAAILEEALLAEEAYRRAEQKRLVARAAAEAAHLAAEARRTAEEERLVAQGKYKGQRCSEKTLDGDWMGRGSCKKSWVLGRCAWTDAGTCVANCEHEANSQHPALCLGAGPCKWEDDRCSFDVAKAAAVHSASCRDGPELTEVQAKFCGVISHHQDHHHHHHHHHHRPHGDEHPPHDDHHQHHDSTQ